MSEKNYTWTSPTTNIKYSIFDCKLCNSFSIKNENCCNKSSCSGNSCEICESDFSLFYKSKLSLESYLNQEELEVLIKAEALKKLILKSSTAGFNEINFNHCACYLNNFYSIDKNN